MHLTKYVAVASLFALVAFAIPAPAPGLVDSEVEARDPRLSLGGSKSPPKPAPAPAPAPAPVKPPPKPSVKPTKNSDTPPKSTEKAAPSSKASEKSTASGSGAAGSSKTKSSSVTVKSTPSGASVKSTPSEGSVKSTPSQVSVKSTPSSVSVKSTPSSASLKSTPKSTPSSASAKSASSASSAAPACIATPGGKSGTLHGRQDFTGRTGSNTVSGGRNQLPAGCSDAIPDGQMDCSGIASQTCATMCYAALCFGTNKNTGIQLEGQTTHTGALTPRPGGTSAARRARTAAGCGGSVRSGFAASNLAGPANGQCDEWPPASSTDGGQGVVLQLVDDQNDQSHAVAAAVAAGRNGLILLRNFGGVPECAALQTQNTNICGQSNKFAIVSKAPNGRLTYNQATF